MHLSCGLISSGPAGANYTANARGMELLAGYFCPYETGFPFVGWWYTTNTITVRCNTRVRTIHYATLDTCEGNGKEHVDQMLSLGSTVSQGGSISVNSKGELAYEAKLKPKSGRKASSNRFES